MNSTAIEQLLGKLTIDEQISLLAGRDFWTTEPIERLNIPSIKVSDGPNGARGGGSLIGGVTAAAFPVGIALAAAWNPALVKQIGAALAREARSKGARVLLAPTVNLHRSTLNGRNFECYSEDPYLSAEIAVAYIDGLQGAGVGATVKHLIGNESEYQRNSISSDIDERTLRELYLIPFEAAVKRAKTFAIMTSYNRLNGTFVSELASLLRGIVREEWGFDGLFMSDWFGTQSTAPAMAGGLDLEMPGPGRHRKQKLIDALASGAVSAAHIREAAGRVLTLIERVGAFAAPKIEDECADDQPATRALIRRAGADGMVLLKNDGVLPLASVAKIAVIGPNAATARIMGGGSAQLNPHYRVSPLDGLHAAAALHNASISYALGCTNDRLVPLSEAPWRIEYFANRTFSGAPAKVVEATEPQFMTLGEEAWGIKTNNISARLTARITVEEAGDFAFGIVASGPTQVFVDDELAISDKAWALGQEFFNNACDEMRATLRLAKGEHRLRVEYRAPETIQDFALTVLRFGAAPVAGEADIAEAVELARQSDVALLFVGNTGEWDGEGIDRPNLDLPGRQNELIERVAAANPKTVIVLQTGAPIVMPWLDKVSAVLQAWYPGQEAGNAIVDVLLGAVDPGGRLPQTFPHRLEDDPTAINYPGERGRVRYGEGIFIGYRYYERKKLAPLFPFGFGLSYASFVAKDFALSAPRLAPGQSFSASLALTNISKRAGSCVAQFYVADRKASVARPVKELKGFVKVLLAPGETKSVHIDFDMRALAFFDVDRHAFVAEAGAFEISAGFSSAEIFAAASLELSADWVEPPLRQPS